jgi:hypothetical protein
MPRLLPFVTASLLLGCSDRHSRMVPPPPEHSGADHPGLYVRGVADRAEGRGHPDRLPAGLRRVVRGDTEVWVEQSHTAGGRILLNVAVRNRNKERPLALGDWNEPGRVTLRDEAGTAYRLLPATAERVRANREWEANEPNPGWRYGAGPVVAGCYRITLLEFEGNPPGLHLDLDLDGGPVGFAEPVLFRIHNEMLTDLFPGAR